MNIFKKFPLKEIRFQNECLKKENELNIKRIIARLDELEAKK